MSLTFGSLFSGIGGFDLGLERAGMVCRWQVEIDRYANAVLERHWPDVARWGDVTTFPPDDGGDWMVDVIAAGPPCQPVSVAGKRKGKGDERWLWGECLRVVAVICPKVFVAENPTGLLSDDRGGTFGAILNALESVGYCCEWKVVSAADLGAPHRRDRVWLVARQDAGMGEMPMLRDVLVPDSRNARARMRLPSDRGMGEQPLLSPHRMADTRGEGLEGSVDQHAGARLLGFCGGARGNQEQEIPHPPPVRSWWEVESVVCRVAHGVPNRVDRLRCLGNAVVPQVAELIGRAIVAAEGD